MLKLSDDTVVHVIFTRFNVRTGGKEKSLRDKDGWLEERYKLFDTYCFPSIVNQSFTEFFWVVFFDEHTPEEYKKKNQLYQVEFPSFYPVYVREWNTETVRRKLVEIIPEKAEWLLTTRLDNDDGLHKDFIKTLRAASFDGNTYFNFPDGLTYYEGNGYRHRDESNAFLSYVEKKDSFDGVWKYRHPEVIQKFKVEQLELPHAWLQVIHGGNVSNKVRGIVEDPLRWSFNYFGLEKMNLKEFSKLDYFLDRFFLSSLRTLRDLIINLVKKIIGR